MSEISKMQQMAAVKEKKKKNQTLTYNNNRISQIVYLFKLTLSPNVVKG